MAITTPAVTTPVRTGTPGTATGTSLASFTDNFNNFLTLLTAQLKNQDPLSPMNATEFTTQLVQFTGVEQMIKQNQNLEQLIGMQRQWATTNALSYIGKTIEANGTSATLANGEARFVYNVGAGATGATIAVRNAAGQVVRTSPVAFGPGQQAFTWNGRSDQGAIQPDGIYTFEVSARNATNQPIAVSTRLTGTVTGVENQNNRVILKIGNTAVPMEDVLVIRNG